MLKFTRREDYAVILVNTLAKEYKKRLVPLSEIAKDYDISLLFLRNLAGDLRSTGIIKAVEGKTGGYYLTKDPKDIKMKDILGVFSNDQHAICCSKNDDANGRVCPKQGHCVAGNVWRQLNKEFIDKVYNLSLHEFLQYKSTQTNT